MGVRMEEGIKLALATEGRQPPQCARIEREVREVRRPERFDEPADREKPSDGVLFLIGLTENVFNKLRPTLGRPHCDKPDRQQGVSPAPVVWARRDVDLIGQAPTPKANASSGLSQARS
jgi:hypothetical protein